MAPLVIQLFASCARMAATPGVKLELRPKKFRPTPVAWALAVPVEGRIVKVFPANWESAAFGAKSVPLVVMMASTWLTPRPAPVARFPAPSSVCRRVKPVVV